LGNLGLAYIYLGETRKALGYLERAMNISRKIGNSRGEGADLGNLGLAYAALGETRKAIEYYEQALAISREIGPKGRRSRLGQPGQAYPGWAETKAIEYRQAPNLP
jgi:tetratricopeptide (TPR) repeat protein